MKWCVKMEKEKTKIFNFIIASLTILLGIIPLFIRIIKKYNVIAFPQTFYFLSHNITIIERLLDISKNIEAKILINILLLFIEVYLLVDLANIKPQEDPRTILIIPLLFLANNVLIYSYQPVPLAVIAFFPILSYYFSKKGNIYGVIISLVGSMFINVICFLITLSIIIFNMYEKKRYNSIIAITTIAMLLLPTLIIINIINPPVVNIPYKIGISEQLSIFGISSFLIIFSILSLVLGNRRKKHIKNFVSVVILLLFTIFFPYLALLTSLFVTYASLITLKSMKQYKWKLENVRSMTLVLLILIPFFLYVSFTSYYVRAEPWPMEEKVLKETKEMATMLNIKNGLVVRPSYKEMAYYYTQILPMEITKDGFREILSYSNYSSAKEYYRNLRIKIVYIDPITYKELWEFSDRGLLYLSKYDKHFYVISKEDSTFSVLIR